MIVAERLSVRYPKGLRGHTLTALDQVSLEIKQGDFFALVGRNGAGKSTLMHCMLGLKRPSAGRVTVMGETPAPGMRAFERIGYLPEEPLYHGYLTVEEAIAYYASLMRRPPPPGRVDALLQRLELADFKSLRVDRCSKGMRQKLGIVQCLLNEPGLLFLDEPMRGLDPMAVREFRDILVELNRAGATVVMNSHILAEVEQVATRVAILEKGRLMAADALREMVRVDSASYLVEFECAAEPPRFLTVDRRQDGWVSGSLPAEHLYAFMDYLRAGQGRLASCSFRRSTLEESFVAALRKAPDA